MFKLLKQADPSMRGVGLLELLLALTVVAVLSVTVIRYYQVTQRHHAVQQAMQTVQAVHLCALHDDINSEAMQEGDLVPHWVMRGQLPASFAQTANPWGGQVHAVMVGSHVRIVLDDVPASSGAWLMASFNEPQAGAQANYASGVLMVGYDLLA
jgi:hypothetical protein